MLYKASAPGSLMLLGEYAVLHGEHALVCAINKRITVLLKPREDDKIFLRSSLGLYETTLTRLHPIVPFQFVLATLQKFKNHLLTGCEIEIQSEFSATIGFASSAAVTVATLAALTAWLQLDFSKLDLIKNAREIVYSVQGLGSGADTAACVLGGMVSYRLHPFVAECLVGKYPITVMYSGSKTPTVEAVKYVEERFIAFPSIAVDIFKAIGSCAQHGIQAVKQQNWVALGQVMNIQQGLMEALGVNTESLQGIIEQLRKQPEILGAKISGSGLGDCVVGLGNVSANMDHLLVEITEQGVYCEKI